MKKFLIEFVPFVFLLLTVSCSSIKRIIPLKGLAQKKPVFTVLWSKNYDPDYKTGNLPIALNGPIAKDGIVYAGHNIGEMRAYDVETGKSAWTVKDGGLSHSTPIVYKDMLIYGTLQGRLFARDRDTGSLKYSVELGSGVETQAVVYKDRLFVHLRNHKIFCLDAQTGAIIWAYKRSMSYKTTLQRASRPFISKDKLYVGFADGYLVAFSAQDGSLLWETKLAEGVKFPDVDTAPKLLFGKIFAGVSEGDIFVLDPKSGKVLSKLPFSSLRELKSIKEKIFIGTKKGKMVVLDENLKLIKESASLDGAITDFAVWKDRFIVVGTIRGTLYALDIKGLKVVDYLSFGYSGSPHFSETSIDGSFLSVITSRNRLHLIK
ncbi:MAG: hypothetical protein CME68_09670 [Halobacteriovoraceae bacterium]|nr:hypothetical protein [Halobacteriovoraceae bacterium]|tara:strand:- start:555 stop:1682 length:1128 start_codon:yes stop_codon:yes gene_type:complete